MDDRFRPITVRDVQAAMRPEGLAVAVAREHIARTLKISDRQLEMLLAEPLALDQSAHAYLAEFDLEGEEEAPPDAR